MLGMSTLRAAVMHRNRPLPIMSSLSHSQPKGLVERGFRSFVSYFSLYFLFLVPSFYFWSGSMRECAMPRDNCTLYKGVLPPFEWSILSLPLDSLSPRSLRFLRQFTLQMLSPPHSLTLTTSQNSQEESYKLKESTIHIHLI